MPGALTLGGGAPIHNEKRGAVANRTAIAHSVRSSMIPRPSSLSCATMDLDDLYGDLDAAPKQLPSAIELRGRLTEVVNEREALEAQLQA